MHLDVAFTSWEVISIGPYFSVFENFHKKLKGERE
jgi:hypothetical protein